jgi:hypothetical protein
LLPPATFVTSLEHVSLDDDQVHAVRMGQRISLDEDYLEEEIAAMDTQGDLVGVLQRRSDTWKPQLVLASHDESPRG